MKLKMLIAGQWTDTDSTLEVKNKYSGDVIATLPVAGQKDVDAAIAAAGEAALEMAEMPTYRRADVLQKTAVLLQERYDDLSRTIAAEAGKALKFARAEVTRAINTFTLAGEEAKRIHGETIPLDAVQAGEGYFGFYLRRPVGVVGAITPFNFPLNLVAHKVAPALAAGNSLVLKPASTTPITAVKLCEILLEAGLPAHAINLVVGPGRTVGECLVSDPRLAKITFTGSPVVGEHILRSAGIKKVTLELGNTSPVIITSDADLQVAAKRGALSAYYNSGQVCISVQRIYVESAVYEPFLEQFIQATEAMVVGDPLDEDVDVGPMIELKEAERIEAWVKEATTEGAMIETGGHRQGAVFHPTVLTHVSPEMRVVAEEAFAPVASVIPCPSFADALEQANRSPYGLQVGVYTRDLQRALWAIQKLDFGGVIINDTPVFRADHMPYGGNKRSGLGREGLKFAIEEMTNIQMVAIRRDS